MDDYKELDFFVRNEMVVSKRICKILLWMTIIFPVLAVCSLLGIFNVTVNELIPIMIIGIVCTTTPAILQKMGFSYQFIKNYSIITMAVTVALMGTNINLGVSITYVLPVALSCMYFDKKFTQKASIIGFVCMVVGVYFRCAAKEINNIDARCYQGAGCYGRRDGICLQRSSTDFKSFVRN